MDVEEVDLPTPTSGNSMASTDGESCRHLLSKLQVHEEACGWHVMLYRYVHQQAVEFEPTVILLGFISKRIY